MLEFVRRKILAILRVPPEPQAPEGAPESVLIFRAGRNLYRWQLLVWALSHWGVAVAVLLPYYAIGRLIAKAPSWVHSVHNAVGIVILLVVSVGLLTTFLALKWSYELRWYIVTDRSLRIRRGVWNVEELTMTFANVQEILIQSGPLQYFLGLANVEVHSAGGDAGPHGAGNPHVACFEGVDNAVEIRDLIVERLRAYRDSGLGGGSEQVKVPERGTATLSAARAVLDEARALRTVLQAANP